MTKVDSNNIDSYRADVQKERTSGVGSRRAEHSFSVIEEAIAGGYTLTPEQAAKLQKATEHFDAGRTVLGNFLLKQVANEVYAAQGNNVDDSTAGGPGETSQSTGELLEIESEKIDQELTEYLAQFSLDDPEQVEILTAFLLDSGMFTDAEIAEFKALAEKYQSGSDSEYSLSNQVELAEYNKAITDAMRRINTERVDNGQEPMFTEGFILDFMQTTTLDNSLGSVVVYKSHLVSAENTQDPLSFQSAITDYALVQQLRSYVVQAFNVAAS
ncbi:MAG: hypothetical protein RLO04_00905 [Limnobacter sp.]|uniref:hypothetical protein n=1 Tax=Limnobacter sp. TaxID=2003368 RepID=UPI0032EE15F7